jgi:hypothetical protein
MATCGHGRAADHAARPRGSARVYERRDVEGDTLQQVVRENLLTFGRVRRRDSVAPRLLEVQWHREAR